MSLLTVKSAAGLLLGVTALGLPIVAREEREA